MNTHTQLIPTNNCFITFQACATKIDACEEQINTNISAFNSLIKTYAFISTPDKALELKDISEKIKGISQELDLFEKKTITGDPIAIYFLKLRIKKNLNTTNFFLKKTDNFAERRMTPQARIDQAKFLNSRIHQ